MPIMIAPGTTSAIGPYEPFVTVMTITGIIGLH